MTAAQEAGRYKRMTVKSLENSLKIALMHGRTESAEMIRAELLKRSTSN